MKLVAVDYGLARTGLAATDPDGILAYPLETIRLDSFPNRRAFLDALAARVLREKPDAVVVGLPLLADGSVSLTTRQIRNFVRKLLHRLPCPVYLMEEFLSSEEAAWDLEEAGLRRSRRKAVERDLRDAGRSAAQGRAVLDQQAAVRILESYLHSPSSATLAEGDGYRAG